MRVAMISKALVVGTYQKKLEELARLPGVELLAIVPPYWREKRVGVERLTRLYTAGYQLIELPMRFNGDHHIHYYPRLWRQLRRFRPDVVHIDEEPFNLVTFHAAVLSRLTGARVMFFSWQNLLRRYPPPFSLFERLNYRLVSAAVAGNQEAAEVLRRKGYRRPLSVIPQFGVDPDQFQPRSETRKGVPQIGFVGRLVPEKGVADLLDAFARVQTRAQLQIVGNGVERARLELRAANLGIRDRVIFRGGLASSAMPDVYRDFDLLVIPSRTLPNWKEQFGRVIIEAMACGVPVIGSDSGEIPHVIGNAGRIFPEGNADRLAEQLDGLLRDHVLRAELGARARERVLEQYTQQRIAWRYYEVYRSMVPELREPWITEPPQLSPTDGR